MGNTDILHELSPLSSGDCLYVIERIKKEFNFPIHIHSEFEINYVENARMAQRVVGDSIEEIDGYDLVLITCDHLEHAWINHECHSEQIREITIQFAPDLITSKLLSKNQFANIRKMFDDAQKGISFPLSTIMRVRSLLNSLTCEKEGFYSVVTFLTLLNELSLCSDYKILSSSSFAQNEQIVESDRVKTVDRFLHQNYHREVKLQEVADVMNMTPISFSRFFKQRSGNNFVDYLTNIRVGYVARLLVDSEKPISDICFECGFNNISNFNRIFKQRKGCSPREFRESYKKKKIIL